MEKQFLFTDDGLKKYESELEDLKANKRKEIADKIKVALSFGDLSENSEYDEAKNEQAKVEARIAELEAMLKHAKVISHDELSDDVVGVGSKVVLKDMEFNENVEYRIVGATEADPMEGLISDESPVGRTLLGSKVGDRLEVEVPAGKVMYQVLEISK